MRHLYAALICLLLCVAVKAQPRMATNGNGPPPAGASVCMSGNVTYRNNLNGELHECVNGAWQLAGFTIVMANSPLLGGGGLADPGTNGMLKRVALNVTAPALAGTDFVVPSALNAKANTDLSNVSGATISVDNFPATQPVSGPLTDAQLRATAVPVFGIFWQATQPVSGTVGINNFPASQTVNGAVSVSNFPATQPVSGYVRLGSATPFQCSLDNIGATLTQCQAAPGAGVRLYITDIVANSTTATAGQMLLRTGTGANCVTSTASILPAAATVVRIPYPANNSPNGPTRISFMTPLQAPVNAALCAIGIATNTLSITITGFISQ